MNEKKVLIIGGTGFIGYHVAKLCSKNYKTTSLSLSIPNKHRKCENVKYIICDISKNSDLDIDEYLIGFFNKKYSPFVNCLLPLGIIKSIYFKAFR